MSLLSTFSILFETDAKKASEDIENLSESLEDIETSSTGAADGLDDVAETADTGAVSMGSLTRAVVGLAAAYVTFDAVSSGVIENALAIDAVGKFSQVIGENIVEMDAWGAAAARNGGSAEAFRGSVESLNTSLADIKISGGGEVVNTLAMIGVRATSAGGHVRSAFDILPQLADSFQRMSASQSFSFGRKLGLDQGTILLLQQGRNAVDELVQRQKMLGGVTKEGYEIAAVFNDQWDDTKRMFNGLWMSANTTILPMLTTILKSLESSVAWMRDNKDFMEGFFIAISGAAGIYAGSIIAAKVATLGLAKSISILKKTTGIGLLIAAFTLLYEDLKKWADGSDSLVGRIFGPFDKAKQSLVEGFEEIKNAFKSLATYIEDLNPFKSLGKSIGSGLYDMLHDDSNDGARASNYQGIVSAYNGNPLNNYGYGSYGSRSSSTTTNNNVTVGGTTVNASGMSTEQASKVVNSSLTGQIEGAIGQLDTGVDR